MGHPCKIMGLSICIMSSVIALLSCQPLFRELKREKKKLKIQFPSSLVPSGEVLWDDFDQWNIRRNRLEWGNVPVLGIRKTEATCWGWQDRKTGATWLPDAMWIGLTSPGLRMPTSPCVTSAPVFVSHYLLVRTSVPESRNLSFLMENTKDLRWRLAFFLRTSYRFHSMGPDNIYVSTDRIWACESRLDLMHLVFWNMEQFLIFRN